MGEGGYNIWYRNIFNTANGAEQLIFKLINE